VQAEHKGFQGLIGPSQALKMMLAGTPMSAKKALQQGVIDAISENSLIDDAIAFLQEKIGSEEHPKVRDKNEKVLELEVMIMFLQKPKHWQQRLEEVNLLLVKLYLV
jgi:enoyl-CoA hydratase/carnithine racemase